MMNADVPLASSRRLIFGGPSDRSPINWIEFVRCQMRADETYSEAKRQFRVRNKDVLMNAHSLICGVPLLSLMCSARVRRYLRLLVGVVDVRLVRLICCQIMLKATSPCSLFICHAPTWDPSSILITLPSSRVRLGVSYYS